MNEKNFERKPKEEKPVIAICYDFDKTLSPDDMQAQGYIQSVGYDVQDFWRESNSLSKEHGMDQNLAYMYKMKQKARSKFVLNKDALEEYGAKVKLFPGVETWFDRIKEYSKDKNVIVEHYIISSGLKEMIEGTSIAKKGAFEKIYASSFYFDDDGVAIWPAQAINYTNKTQFLFRIQKGTLDINDPAVNDYFKPEDIRIPFRNIVYIGDSDTDIPCMKLVNNYGGHSIGVYNCETLDKTKVYNMIRDNRVKYYAAADYNENSDLDKLIKSIIDRTIVNEKLEFIHYDCKKEYLLFEEENDTETIEKRNLINALANSKDFENTHIIIEKLNNVKKWSDYEKELLFDIALNVHAVSYIINDIDVKNFYMSVIKNEKILSEKGKKVKNMLK